MARTTLLFFAAALFCAGCKETIVEYRDSPTPTLPKATDAYHGDLVGKVKQSQSGAVVIVSQVGPIDSSAVSAVDGSFAIRYLQAGNYDLKVRANNLRIYERSNVMIQGGAVTFAGEIDLSTIPDLISSVYPENGSEVVYDWRYGRITISIMFAHPMDRASVERAFSTTPPSTGIFYWGQYAQSPRSMFYGTLSPTSGYDLGAVITTYSKITSMTYSMARNYSFPDTSYTIHISTDAKDTSGNHLRFPLSSSFKTVQSYVTYSSIQTNPVNGDVDVVPLYNTGITLTFPRRMDQASTEAATTVTPVMNRVFLWPQENVLLVYTGGPFLSDTTITVTVASDAKDKDGVPLGEAFSFWFRTAPFQTTYSSPSNAQLFVPTNQSIYLNFDNYADKGSVATAFSITPSVAGSFAYDRGYNNYDILNTVIFTPSMSLQTNTKYTVTVSTWARDLYGTPMRKPYTFSFVTRPN